MKKLTQKIKKINEAHFGYSKNDMIYIIVMIAGICIFCIGGLKYRQIAGLIVGALVVATSLYLFIREGEDYVEANDQEDQSGESDL